jgi:hypothetical protein
LSVRSVPLLIEFSIFTLKYSSLGATLRLCQHFQKLDEIYGCKASITPPFVIETIQGVASTAEPPADEVAGQLTFINEIQSMTIINFMIICLQLAEEIHIIIEENDLRPTKPLDTIIHDERSLPAKTNNKLRHVNPRERFGINALTEARNKKTELDLKKLEFEGKKLELEKEKLSLEEKKVDRELELKKYEIDLKYRTQYEIARLSFEL